MNSLATDIRKLIAGRLETASASDVMAIATQLCANDEPILFKPTAAGNKAPWVKVGADGRALPFSATEWVVNYDRRTGLMWTRHALSKDANHKDSMQKCTDCRLLGFSDWRGSTVQEQVAALDYTRFPVLDTSLFEGGTGGTWTSTLDPEDPASFAFVVFLRYGGVGRFHRDYRFSVRAVRAGQPLGLWD